MTMPYILTVSLRQYQGKNYLYVDESKKMNEVCPNPNRPQHIYWMLDDKLLDQGGRFVPTAPPGVLSGFRWDAEIPWNFEYPILVGDGAIMIKDHNCPGDSDGSWSYTLTIELQNRLCSTVPGQHELHVSSGNSPLIHNKTMKPQKAARKKK
jgi:hypothetical protein